MTWTPQAAQFLDSFTPPKNPAQPSEPGLHTENPAHGPVNRMPMPGSTSVMEPVKVASKVGKIASVAKIAAAL